MDEVVQNVLFELRKNVNKGIKYIKELINIDKSMPFEQYAQQKKERSLFRRCTANDNNMRIFFHCRECCKSPSSIMCLKCYLKGDHKNHNVKIISTDKSVCDCGDESSIKPEGWCSDHRISEIILITDEESKAIFQSSYALLCFISESMEEKQTKRCIKSINILKLISSWGSSYIDIVSKALFDGGWDNSPFSKILKQWRIASPRLSEKVNSLFFELVTSEEFTSGYARCSPNALIEASKFFTNEEYLFESTDFLLLSSQCFSDADSLFQINKETQLFSRLVCASTHTLSLLFKEDGKENVRFSNFRFPDGKIQTQIFDRFFEPIFAMLRNQKFVIESIKAEDSMEALTQFITFSSIITPITRKTGDKVEYNTSDYYNSFVIFSSFISPIISLGRGISCAFSNISNSQNDSWDAPCNTLKDCQVDVLKTMIRNVLMKCNHVPVNSTKSLLFGKEVEFVDIYANEFYPFDVSPLLFGSLILYTSIHNHIPASLFQFTEKDVSNMEIRLFSMIGGIHMAACGLFSRNDDTVPEVLGYLTTISQFLGAAQALASTTNDSGAFVTRIAESFGLSQWIRSNSESATELTQCIALLLRFIIQLGSDNTFACYSEKRLRQDALIHFLKSGYRTRDELLIKTSAFLGDYDLDELLMQTTTHTRVDGITHFKLLPEYDSQTNLFSFFLEIPDYLKIFPILSKTIPKCVEKLPPSEELSRISQIFTCKEMELLIRTIVSTAETESKRNQHLIYNLLCVIYMIKIHTSQKWLIEGESKSVICTVLDMVSSDDDRIQYVKQFLSQFDDVKFLSEKYLTSKERAPIQKITIETVLKSFQNSNQFSDISPDSESSNHINKEDLICAICQNSIKKGQNFGMLASFFETDILDYASRIINETDEIIFPPFLQFRTCGHFCHISCYQTFNANRTTPVCPYDRTHSNIIIPLSDISNNIKEIEEIISQNSIIGLRQTVLQNISVFELLTRTKPERINDSNMIKMLQSMIDLSFFSSDEDSISIDPFTTFGVSILSKGDKTQSIFAEELKPFWTEVISNNINEASSFIRRCSILYHLISKTKMDSYPSNKTFAKLFNISLPETEIPIPHPIHFPKLHKSFIEFFISEERTKYLNSSDYDVGQCLLCGEIFYLVPPRRSAIPSTIGINSMIEHVNRCCCGRTVPILFLTGNIATAVDVFDKDHPLRYSFGSIYSDNFGDYDEGLRRGSILTLDNEREAKLIEILLDGTLKRYIEQRVPDSLEELQTVEARARFIAEM